MKRAGDVMVQVDGGPTGGPRGSSVCITLGCAVSLGEIVKAGELRVVADGKFSTATAGVEVIPRRHWECLLGAGLIRRVDGLAEEETGGGTHRYVVSEEGRAFLIRQEGIHHRERRGRRGDAGSGDSSCSSCCSSGSASGSALSASSRGESSGGLS